MNLVDGMDEQNFRIDCVEYIVSQTLAYGPWADFETKHLARVLVSIYAGSTSDSLYVQAFRLAGII